MTSATARPAHRRPRQIRLRSRGTDGGGGVSSNQSASMDHAITALRCLLADVQECSLQATAHSGRAQPACHELGRRAKLKAHDRSRPQDRKTACCPPTPSARHRLSARMRDRAQAPAIDAGNTMIAREPLNGDVREGPHETPAVGTRSVSRLSLPAQRLSTVTMSPGGVRYSNSGRYQPQRA